MLPEVAEAWDNRLNIQAQVAKVDFWLCLEFADLEHCLTRTGLQVLPFNDEREKKKQFHGCSSLSVSEWKWNDNGYCSSPQAANVPSDKERGDPVN